MARPNCVTGKLLYHTAVYSCTHGTTELCYWQLLYHTAVYRCTNGATELWLLATTVSYWSLQLYKWRDRTIVTGSYYILLQSTAVQMARPNCCYWQLLYRTAIYSCTNGTTELWLLATTVPFCSLQLYKWHDWNVVTGNYCTILQSTAVQMARPNCGYWQLLYLTAVHSCNIHNIAHLWVPTGQRRRGDQSENIHFLPVVAYSMHGFHLHAYQSHSWSCWFFVCCCFNNL